jgi:hypothetical protein
MKYNFVSLNNFVETTIKDETFAFFITTLQMTQALCFLENKIEIIHNIRCFHITPNMTVIFLVYSLHLARVPFWVFNERKFKKHITIEFHRNKQNLVNQQFIVVKDHNSKLK